MMMSWSATNHKHRQLVESISALPAAKEVRSHLAQEGHTFKTWRDTLLERRARATS